MLPVKNAIFSDFIVDDPHVGEIVVSASAQANQFIKNLSEHTEHIDTKFHQNEETGQIFVMVEYKQRDYKVIPWDFLNILD